jgi:hypothetical protein
MNKKGFRKLIKNFDIIGRKVELNFDEKGASHKTIFGGYLSITYGIFILAFSIYCFTNI